MSASIRTEAHVDRQVSLGVRLAYGVGSVADGVKNVAFNAFLVLYYTTVLGLPGTLSGLAIFIALCVDAITDPLVGSLSDSLHTRWGRRHPFMLFAALPMALCFCGLFAPPAGLSQMGLFAWLTIFAIGVRLFLTFYMVPSSAMAPEMTTHYDERTTLNSFRWLLGWTGSLVLASVGWFYFLADPGEQVGEGRLEAANYPAIGVFAGGMVFLAIVISTLGTAKLIPRLRQAQGARQTFSWARFLHDLRVALRSHSLRILLGSSLLAAAALGVSEVLGTFMNTWFWEFRSEQLGILTLFQIVPLLIGVAMVRPLSARMDKRSASIRLALFAILWGPIPVVLRLLGLAPENGSPMLMVLIMAHGMLMIAAVIQIGILNGAMVMDAIDESEFETGERHEGLFVSTLSFTGKAVSGFGNFLGGVILDLIRFPTGAAATVGEVPAEAIMRLGLVAGPGLIIFYLCSIALISRLRLTRERYDEIASALEARRTGEPPA
ncbi:MAG: MFS transporter [Myxococcota bacterium]|nr:MFS transporter [Myxococcota bacterium]